jgi:glutathione S-transferase
MWLRRVDLSICEPLANGFRASEGYEMFKDRFRVLPEAADGLKAIAQDNLRWLDADMADRETIAGGDFSIADIHLFAFLKFGAAVGQPIDPSMKNLSAWFERTAARPSASA